MFPLIVLAVLLVPAMTSAQIQSDDDGDWTAETSEIQATAEESASDGKGQSAADRTFSVDAAGTMTILPDKVYAGNVQLDRGNLIVSDGAEIDGSVTVASSVTIKAEAKVRGSVRAASLVLGANSVISGAVALSSADPVSVGDNAEIEGTLTTRGGLKLGSNANVKLFLSGESAIVDGKTYPLPGKVLSRGGNSSVGLPPVPNMKNADGTAAAVVQNPVQTSAADPVTRAEDDDSDDDVSEDSMTADAELESFEEEFEREYENVSDVQFSGDTVALDYDTPAKFLGFIPFSVPAHIEIDKDATVSVSYPWYSFLFKTEKEAVDDSIGAAVSGLIATSTGEVSPDFSAKLQTAIAKSVVSILSGLFGN